MGTGPEDSETVYVDIQVSSTEVAETVDSATVLVDLEASGTEQLITPFEYIDTATVYVDIRVRGVEETAFWETFENLDAWDIDPAFPLRENFYITKRHATDGPSALRFMPDTVYTVDSAQLAIKWIDTVLGDNPAVKYWLSYAFMLEDWERVWRDNNNPQNMYLPAQIALEDTFDGNFGVAPTIEALSATTGQIHFDDDGGPVTIAINAKQWYRYQIGYQDDGTDITFESWLDGAKVAEVVTSLLGSGNPLHIPKGIWIGSDLSNVSAIFYVDDMIWSPGVQPRQPSSVESAPGTTEKQWVRIREKETGGAAADVTIDIPAETEAWLYAEVYVSSDMQFGVDGSNEFSAEFVQTDNTRFGIKRVGLSSVWNWTINGSDTGIPVVFDVWHRLSWHELAGSTALEYRINDDIFNTTYTAPTHINFISALHPYVWTGSPQGAWIGVDNLAFSTEDWVRAGRFDEHWDFEGLDPLGGAVAPFSAQFGPGDYIPSLEEQGVGPGPGLPEALSSDDAEVYILFTITATEQFPTSDDAVVLVDVGVTSLDAYGTTDAATVLIDLQVQGGECFSSFSGDFLGEGEATMEWSGTDRLEWASTDNLEWSPGLVSSEAHC